MNFQVPFPLLFGSLVVFDATISGSDATRPNFLVNETCTTETRELHIVRESQVQRDGGTITISCVGRIMVRECDGECLSNVAPSVVKFPELEKECKCCKEGDIVPRTVVLRECSNGNEVIHGYSITAHIREPINCSCQLCRN